MLTDDDKCPKCGNPIVWGADADAVRYCGIIKPIQYAFIACEGDCGFSISDWDAVGRDTYMGTRNHLLDGIEQEYRRIVRIYND